MDKENAFTNLNYELDISKGVVTKLKADVDAKNKEIHQIKEAEKRVSKELASLKTKIEDLRDE